MSIEFTEIKLSTTFQMINLVNLLVQRIGAVFYSGLSNAIQNNVEFLVADEKRVVMRFKRWYIEEVEVGLAYRNYGEVPFRRISAAFSPTLRLSISPTNFAEAALSWAGTIRWFRVIAITIVFSKFCT